MTTCIPSVFRLVSFRGIDNSLAEGLKVTEQLYLPSEIGYQLAVLYYLSSFYYLNIKDKMQKEVAHIRRWMMMRIRMVRWLGERTGGRWGGVAVGLLGAPERLG